MGKLTTQLKEDMGGDLEEPGQLCPPRRAWDFGR